MKIRLVVAQVSLADRQTDRGTDKDPLRNFANAPKYSFIPFYYMKTHGAVKVQLLKWR